MHNNLKLEISLQAYFVSHIFWCAVFSFPFNLKYVLIYLVVSFMIHLLFRSMVFNFQVLGYFPVVSPLLVFQLSFRVFVLATGCSSLMWGLSSQTKDWTQAAGVKAPSPGHETPRELAVIGFCSFHCDCVTSAFFHRFQHMVYLGDYSMYTWKESVLLVLGERVYKCPLGQVSW